LKNASNKYATYVCRSTYKDSGKAERVFTTYDIDYIKISRHFRVRKNRGIKDLTDVLHEGLLACFPVSISSVTR